MTTTIATLREQAQRLLEVGRKLQQKKQTTIGRAYLPAADAAEWDARVRALLSQPLLPTVYLQRYAAVAQLSNIASNQEGAMGVVAALIADVNDRHLPSIGAIAHASTLSDLLEQAENKSNAESVAAVMLAGGVLEAHLRFLGEQRKVTITGDSALKKWNDALCDAGVYDKSMRHTIDGWIKMRNDADHLAVTSFQRAQVDAMLVSIRTLMQTLPQ